MTIPRRTLLLATSLLPAAAPAELTTLDGVMALLAARRGGTARFTESREFPELSMPLPSSGTLRWQPPAFLEKRTTDPIEEVLRIEGDRLLFERPAQNIRREIGLDDAPELRPLVESMRATLSGDLATLRQHFEVGFQTLPNGRWQLALTPRAMRVYAALQSVRITGRADALLSVVTRGNEGETTLEITPGP
ncbi:LolA-related protein [Pseudoroseomonas globiformis]|uniref:LolA-related protein n=1 Tax=Teichococcus globiformis TaxID=2307229 RepID=A0ABV7G3R7_9PROT